ncbi:MAG: rhomboid family intramembrane serine protease [Lachnospiraceae bacterium]
MTEKKPTCTIVIAVLNIIVFLGLSFVGRTEDGVFMLGHGAMYVPYVLERGEYYRWFTSLFLHFGISHLVNNMVLLVLLGKVLEQEVGHIKYLLIYFMSGLGGNLLSAFMDIRRGDYVISGGASGAIFGMIGALLYIALRNKGRIGNLTGRGILFMAALSLYFGFTSVGVDNFAHIGGLCSGVILALLLYWKKNGNRGSNFGSRGYF